MVENSNGSLVLNGIITSIVKNVAKWMNISSLTFIREPEDRFGTFENNTWNGMVGMLYRKEVDLILNPILPKSSLLEFAYFTNPVTVEAYTILSGKISHEGSLFQFFSVLDTKVWVTIIFTAIVIAVTSALVFITLTVLKQYSLIKIVGEYFWILLSHMLRQNPSEKYLFRKSKTKRSLFLQLLIMLWVLGIGILVMTACQSLLVSKLSVRRSSPIIDTMEDLLHTDATIGIAPVEIQLGDVLENSGISVYEEAWKKIKPNLMPGSKVFSDETLEDVQRGKFCIFHGHLILENRLSEFYKKNSYCQLHLSQHYFFPFPLILAMQRQLPTSIHEVFNFGITRSIEAGQLGRHMKPVLEVSNMCTSYSDKKLKSLGLKNIYGVLLIWAAGLTSGTVVLACEILYKRLI